MTGLLAKIEVGLLAKAHQLIDEVLDFNSVPVIKQYIRRLENAIEEMAEQVANSNGNLTTIGREKEKISGRVDELNHNIDAILTDGNASNDHLAEKWEADLGDLDVALKTKGEALSIAEQTAKALEQTMQSMISRKQAMIAQINQLEAMEQTAAAKEQAAESMEAARSIAATIEGGASVDNIAANIQRRSDVADARLNLALNDVSASTGIDERTEMAKIRLEQRRRRLSGESTTSTTSASTVLPAINKLES